MFRRSGRDLEDYRAHYPTAVDNANLNRNLQFYQNAIPMQPERLLIDEALQQWNGNYWHLEASHSYVQWLFPIQEQGMNWQAQPMQKHEIMAFRADDAIMRRAVRAFAMMLDFYGFVLANATTGEIRALPDDKREGQVANLQRSAHNYLRITRILKFLGELGLERLKLGFLNALHREIFITRKLSRCASSYEDYWIGTIYHDGARSVYERGRVLPLDRVDDEVVSPSQFVYQFARLPFPAVIAASVSLTDSSMAAGVAISSSEQPAQSSAQEPHPSVAASKDDGARAADVAVTGQADSAISSSVQPAQSSAQEPHPSVAVSKDDGARAADVAVTGPADSAIFSSGQPAQPPAQEPHPSVAVSKDDGARAADVAVTGLEQSEQQLTNSQRSNVPALL